MTVTEQQQQQQQEQQQQQQHFTETVTSKQMSSPSSSSSTTGKPATVIRIGTRKSPLALAQTYHVRSELAKHWPHLTFELLEMTTVGDRILDVPMAKIGEKALFTKDLEVALAAGRIDMIVHSLKDLPTTLPRGLMLGAVLEREDPRDAFVLKASLVKEGKIKRIEDLPHGAVVGTSSHRRIAQLKRRFPHLQFMDVRGNVGTRLTKLDDENQAYSALIMATAGLVRVDLAHRVTQRLDPDIMMYAVGQASLGIECRSGDENVLTLLQPLVHRPSQLRCIAERSMMRELEGGCSIPMGVHTEWSQGENGSKKLSLTAIVASLDGSELIETHVENVCDNEKHAEQIGLDAADALREKGVDAILDEIRSDKALLPPPPTAVASSTITV
ncbi:porphobilinogen deaminase-like protein [Ramicandelaber brevisporus]|nr:porphobilinogen deaminase-like protein [Ramicandelaber brevisporus]